MQEDRRRYPRIQITGIAELLPTKRFSDIEAFTKDISLTGARICSNKYLEQGRIVKLRLRENDANREFERHALVAWSNPVNDEFGQTYEIGLNIPE